MPVGAAGLGETATPPLIQRGGVSRKRGNVADFAKTLLGTAGKPATKWWQAVAAVTAAR